MKNDVVGLDGGNCLLDGLGLELYYCSGFANPLIETREVGAKAVVTIVFSNPKCPKKLTTWHSQPMMPGTKIADGNFLLCMTVLLAEILKVLLKITKEKDCKALNEWIKPCENLLQWSATSTFNGNGLVISAKCRSFLRHVVNKHSDHSDPLFIKCSHGSDIPDRKWLKPDSQLYEKVSAAPTNQRLIKSIQQASPLDQTSCLERFHSVLNRFAPKMIAYF
ncbi:Hypothetical predicted protein [Paramuricea clavata]|uniref:Uncharacterized protein n=1 Tax=Paramuricea clavata TaxID=317549 RepID=A0A7D9EA26_PARCT|nr:Hypothetical predicted protein [Paramuricea clavata]